MAPFKVAIVGGGITGLVAALHLDRVGIDFVLLEAYDDITPEVGASLALYPNFQRVLSQLGVLGEALLESSELRTLACRDLEGKPMFEHHVADALHAATGGYGIATFTRTQLLRILHGNISDEGKTRILTGQRVQRIEHLAGDEGVRLHIEDGASHDADMVIGADGTHSVVRSEMWRLGQQEDARAFQGDQSEARHTEFGCVFGLSKPTGDLRNDFGYQVSSQDMTIGLFGGHDGGALWFIFFKVGEDKDKHRWTEEEGAAICESFAHAKLTETTTFGDVYTNRYRMTTQPCPNHCLRQWTWGRLICLGDAVANMNPVLAQGGAQGAESVQMLVDRLVDALEQHKDNASGRLPRPQIERILQSVNAERLPRIRASVDKSQQIIRISAWSTWLYRLIGKYIAPWLPTWVIVAQALEPWKGAYISKSLPAPKAISRAGPM